MKKRLLPQVLAICMMVTIFAPKAHAQLNFAYYAGYGYQFNQQRMPGFPDPIVYFTPTVEFGHTNISVSLGPQFSFGHHFDFVSSIDSLGEPTYKRLKIMNLGFSVAVCIPEDRSELLAGQFFGIVLSRSFVRFQDRGVGGSFRAFGQINFNLIDDDVKFGLYIQSGINVLYVSGPAPYTPLADFCVGIKLGTGN